MEGLGRVFNVVPNADTAWINLRDCAGITFVCVGATDETFTLNQATDVGGSGAKALSVIEHYYYSSAAAGATAWARSTAPTSASVVTTPVGSPAAVIEVSANSLDDGFQFVRLTGSSTGTIAAILHDLNVQRDPTYLAAPATSA